MVAPHQQLFQASRITNVVFTLCWVLTTLTFNFTKYERNKQVRYFTLSRSGLNGQILFHLTRYISPLTIFIFNKFYRIHDDTNDQ